ncbi:MAG: peptidase U32 family protein [Christensenellales bacterium]
MSFYDKYVDWTYLHTDLPRCPHNINAPYDLWEMLDTDVLVPYPLYDTEILAPATASTYKDAVRAGADAVYFGYGKLNARATAENLDNFFEIVSFCHRYGAKAYLALNVMLKDSEIEDAKKIIAEAEKAKIDAFIISDLALVPIIKRMSGAAIHASTQMGIHNRAGAKFAYELGIDRVVLSRETTPNDICDILRNVDVEAEVFCHGALCTGFSGACLLSSMLTGKSGNRGRCAQLCRHRYSCYVNGEKADEGYLLSSKDICMASKFDELEDLCVNSLKIEGRLKNKNYVEGVTGAYVALKEGDAVFDEEISDKLKSYFNRGNFTRGYWDDSDIIYKGAPNHIGVR